MLLHLGGYQGVEGALASYEAGLGQGDPISALLHCLLGELRAALFLSSAGLLARPARPLRRFGWIDDTSWLAESYLDAQCLVAQRTAIPARLLLQRSGPGAFIYLLGRHALPHQLHQQALAKFMKAGRWATTAVTQLSLPSHSPIGMYNGVAGGTQRWCAQVRPPLYCAMRLGDLLVASRLRSI